jgi:hypothetical protein
MLCSGIGDFTNANAQIIAIRGSNKPRDIADPMRPAPPIVPLHFVRERHLAADPEGPGPKGDVGRLVKTIS